MNKAETIAGLAFAALGAFMAFESARLPYLLEGVPGPGFLPRWIAFGLIAAGLVLAAKAVRPRYGDTESGEWPDARGWKRVVLLLGALAVSLLILEKLGFFATTALFMLAVLFGLGVRSPLTLALVPLLASGGLYLVFAVWLRVPLPKGVFAWFG